MDKRFFFIAIQICALLILASHTVYGKDSGCIVRGRVEDSHKGRPLEFANIVASDSTGRALASAFTHKDGTFSLMLPDRSGKYKLKVTYVGFKTVTFDLDCAGREEIDAGTVVLEEGESLQGAGISEKQLLRRESDRIVYDVQGDPDAHRMNMAEFMEKIPELKQDYANRGKLSYEDVPIREILIDDKENGLINQARQYPMKFIQASYMSKIELVLPGSPEYGNEEPILLITLEEKLPVGFASELTALVNSRNSYSGGADGVVNTPWFGLGVHYGILYSHPRELTDSTSRQLLQPESGYGYLGSASASRSESLSHNLGLNLFRTFLDDRIDFQVSLNTNIGEDNGYSRSGSVTRDADGSIVRSTATDRTYVQTSPMRLNGGVALSYNITRKKRIDFKYTYKDNRSRRDELMSYNDGTGVTPEEYSVLSGNGTAEHDANLDLKLQDEKNRRWGLLANARYIDRKYDNSTDYRLFDAASGSFISDISRFDGLDYRQQVATVSAICISNFFKRKLSVGAGLRGEYLINRGTYLNTGTPMHYEDWNIMPSASFAFRFGLNSLSAGYSSSVRRPKADMLNPYRDISDPENIVTGNPDLKGEYTHSVNAGYSRSFRIKWLSGIDISYTYSATPNAIERLTEVSPENISLTTYGNIGNRSSHSVSAEVNLRPVKSLFIKLHGGYTVSDYILSDGNRNTVGIFNASASITAAVKNWSIHSITALTPTQMSAQTKESILQPYMTVMVSKTFSKINLGISLNCEDLLHGNSMKKSVIGSEDFIQTRLTQRLGRTFSLSVYWQFGKFRKRGAVEQSAYDM